DVTRVSIGADSGVAVIAVTPAGSAPGKRTEMPRASFTALSAATSQQRFRVQVGSFAAEGPARAAADKAHELSALSPSVAWSGERQTYQVRLGQFANRDEARAVAATLSRGGFTGAFPVEEAEAGGGLVRLLESGEGLRSALVLPARPTELLFVDAQPY